MDPISNPYTPGAGSRPPALTGRDAEIQAFRILLGRIQQGRPEKSLLITGLRGVGKTVLLSTFRDLAEPVAHLAVDGKRRLVMGARRLNGFARHRVDG